MLTKKHFLFSGIILSLVVAVQSVAAQNVLEDIFSPLFSGLNLASFYQNYSSFIDFVLLAMIFIGLAHMTLGRRFAGSGGRVVGIAVGLSLSFAIIYWMSTNGYTIGDLGPLAAMILVALLAVALYEMMRAFGWGGALAISFLYILIYAVMQAIFPNLFTWIGQHASILRGLLALGFLAAVIIFIWQLWVLVASAFTGAGGPRREHPEPVQEVRRDEAAEREREHELDRVRREEAEEQREDQRIHALNNIQRRLNQQSSNANALERRIQQGEIHLLQELAALLRELSQIAHELEQIERQE